MLKKIKRGQQEKRKTIKVMDWLHKRRHGLSLQEQSGDAEDRTLCTSFIQRATRSRSLLKGKYYNTHVGSSSFSEHVLACFWDSPETSTTLYQLWQKEEPEKPSALRAKLANYNIDYKNDTKFNTNLIRLALQVRYNFRNIFHRIG